MSNKTRLDNLLVERGLCDTRSQAQGLILAGKVRVNGQRVDKAGTPIAADAEVTLTEKQKFVSRGGLKLEKALDVFQINPSGLVCLDIGAATGGFTDCLLQRGAEKVYAVDVGHGQLDWKLRNDPRVVVMEKTNIRHLSASSLADKINLVVCDASFISLKKTLPPTLPFFTDSPIPQIIALLKPQFEYKDYIQDSNFTGVVNGEDRHEAIILGLLEDLLPQLPGWSLHGLNHSPITGPEGNIEYLLWLKKLGTTDFELSKEAVTRTVIKSYADHRPQS